MIKNIRKCFMVALFMLCLAVASSCSSPEYPPVATPQITPITPPARQDLPEGGAFYAGGAGADWSQGELEAVRFIQSAPIYFYYDSSALTESAKAVLNQKAQAIKANPQFRVNIGGHCDERGTEAYNYALGGKRARAARDYLIQRGVPAAQLDISSYGKANPVAPGQGEAAWSQNRRADFTVSRR